MANVQKKIRFFNVRISLKNEAQTPIDNGEIIFDWADQICSLELNNKTHAPYKKEHWIFSCVKKTEPERVEIIFESSQVDPLPDQFNHVSRLRKNNPKVHGDGDVERTHVVILKSNSEIVCAVETNGNGTSHSEVEEYFNYMHRKHIYSPDLPEVNIRLKPIASQDFLGLLRTADKIKGGRIYATKGIFKDGDLGPAFNQFRHLAGEIEISFKIKDPRINKDDAERMVRLAYERLKRNDINSSLRSIDIDAVFGRGAAPLNSEFTERMTTVSVSRPGGETGYLSSVEIFNSMTTEILAVIESPF